MERLKSICYFILCTSFMVFCTTFVDSIYPKGGSNTDGYKTLIEQDKKIIDKSSIEEKYAEAIISEEEFFSHVDRNIVVENAVKVLENTELYSLAFDDEQRANIGEQFALLYEQQINAQENKEYIASMTSVRSIVMLLGVLNATIIIAIHMKKKNI